MAIREVCLPHNNNKENNKEGNNCKSLQTAVTRYKAHITCVPHSHFHINQKPGCASWTLGRRFTTAMIAAGGTEGVAVAVAFVVFRLSPRGRWDTPGGRSMQIYATLNDNNSFTFHNFGRHLPGCLVERTATCSKPPHPTPLFRPLNSPGSKVNASVITHGARAEQIRDKSRPKDSL